MVQMPGQCRLDVRVSGRQITLLADAEDAFWARFYESVPRERVRTGDRYVDVQQWRLNASSLATLLTPFWLARVGPRSAGSAHPPGSGRPKSQTPRAPRSEE